MPLLAHDPLGATQHQIFNADYDGTANLVYFGMAAPGSLDSDQAWLIFKLTWDGSGRVLTKRYTNGSLDYNQVWDDRATLTYA